MCTIVAFDRVNEAFPLIIIAVRDESYARPSTPPLVIDVDPKVVAPTDLIAGGTWLGVRRDGYFAALTNQEDGEHRDGTPSRGLLVREVLRSGVAWPITCLDPQSYNSYNLLHGRPEALWLSTVFNGSVSMTQQRAGVHVVCNDEVYGTYDLKKARLRAFSQFLPTNTTFVAPILQFAQFMTDDHHLASVDPFFATCVHTPDYGTKSVSVIIFPKFGTPRFFHAEGAACESRPFDDFSDLLR